MMAKKMKLKKFRKPRTFTVPKDKVLPGLALEEKTKPRKPSA
jgi:hypothetical protein